MAILQVNGRPANFSCCTSDSQRGEIAKDKKFQPGRGAINSLSNPALQKEKIPTLSSSPYRRVVWKLMPSTPVGYALNSARQRLVDADIPTARYDSEIILAYVLGQTRDWIYTHYDYELTAKQSDDYMALIVRRASHESIENLIGSRV